VACSLAAISKEVVMHREQACTSIFPTWRIKKILQATDQLLAEYHLRFQVISKTP
jgi:hypothetical protein